MEKKIIILLITVFILCNLNAQVTINEDQAISDIMQRHLNQNKSSPTISGWRIQLLATTDRRKVEREEAKFIQEHPTIKVNWEHSKPYYKLKAGAFATKLEATRLLKELKQTYYSAIITKSEVDLSEILD